MAERKVLIIDDDETLLPMLRTAFQRYKFDVVTTRDGSEGLELAVSQKPDLVLISVELPVGNGFLVCKEFKQNPDVKHIPIIITSRKATDADFEKHRKLKIRADDYLHKPFSDEELFVKVGNVVGFSLSADEYTELEAKVHDFLEERTKLESEISEKGDRIADLESELAEAKERIDELDRQIEELGPRAQAAGEFEAQVTELEEALARQKKESDAVIAGFEKTAAQWEKKFGVAWDELEPAIADWKKGAERAEKLIGDLESAQERATTLEAEVSSLKSGADRDAKKRQKLREVLEKAMSVLD